MSSPPSARTRHSRRLALVACGAAALGILGCRKPVDQAAKARIFSPEEPPKFVTHAAEDLGPDSLASNPAHLRRVMRMSAAEAAERLGPNALTAKLSFDWMLGPREVTLDEVHTLTSGARGEFTARLDAGDKLGESKQGMEIVRVDGRVFARSRFGKFRERARDRGAAEKYRDQIFGVLTEMYDLLQGRLALSPDGQIEVDGRKAIRYRVSLSDGSPPPLPGPTPPPAAYPKDGPDPHLGHELDFEQKRLPRSLDGTLDVDAESAVVLASELKAVVDAPGDGPGQRATLRVSLTSKITDVGKDPRLAPPKDALPDEGRPAGIAAALERFDLPRASKTDAGSGSALVAPDEPE